MNACDALSLLSLVSLYVCDLSHMREELMERFFQRSQLSGC